MLNYQMVFTGAAVLPYSMYLILFVDQYQTTEREPAELLLITYHQASSTREGFHAFPCFFQGKNKLRNWKRKKRQNRSEGRWGPEIFGSAGSQKTDAPMSEGGSWGAFNEL